MIDSAIDYETEFKTQREGLHYQSQAEVCIAQPGEILWISAGFQEIFAIAPVAVKGKTLSELLKIVGLTDWVRLIQRIVRSDAATLEGKTLEDYLRKDYSYASGAKIEAFSSKGDKVIVIVTLSPLLIHQALHFGVFFNVRETSNPKESNIEKSDSLGVFIAKMFMELSKGNPLVFTLALTLLVGAGVVWKADNIIKLFKEFPSLIRPSGPSKRGSEMPRDVLID
jgi:hypothetical protein